MSTQATASEIAQSFRDEEAQTKAEHISMGSNDAELTTVVELNKIGSHFKVSNRLHGTNFSYVLYEEGFLKVRKRKGNEMVQDHYLSLRFLSDTPKISRVIAKRTHFFTASGDCEVLRLMGSGESYRTCRAIVPELCQAIRAAQTQNPTDRALYLREAMHEHYRLQRASVISRDACTTSTRRILTEFQ